MMLVEFVVWATRGTVLRCCVGDGGKQGYCCVMVSRVIVGVVVGVYVNLTMKETVGSAFLWRYVWADEEGIPSSWFVIEGVCRERECIRQWYMFLPFVRRIYSTGWYWNFLRFPVYSHRKKDPSRIFKLGIVV